MFDSVNAFAIYILIPDVTLKNAECKDCNLKKTKTHITWYKSNQKVLGLVVAWHLGVSIPEKILCVSYKTYKYSTVWYILDSKSKDVII